MVDEVLRRAAQMREYRTSGDGTAPAGTIGANPVVGVEWALLSTRVGAT
jgi:hypothetical protein